MTKADKIYKVKCTYDMSSKNITFGMMPIRLVSRRLLNVNNYALRSFSQGDFADIHVVLSSESNRVSMLQFFTVTLLFLFRTLDLQIFCFAETQRRSALRQRPKHRRQEFVF